MDGRPTASGRTEPLPIEASPCLRSGLTGDGLGGHPGSRRMHPRVDDLSARNIVAFLDEQIRAVERELLATLRRS